MSTTPGRRVTPLDPNTPAGRAAADSLSQALAEILVAVERRERASRATATQRAAA
ncbi:hypothetical protein ACQEVZ_20135 [Dactylosporangium sp. CA-152071]|uniref:hypothetical protein n=1 Tax=Dactylosporangium sp. CA-152071 TaxID=3239933 RepID=UPI003D8C6B0B